VNREMSISDLVIARDERVAELMGMLRRADSRLSIIEGDLNAGVKPYVNDITSLRGEIASILKE
jgi:hypothetical protein